MRTYMHGGSCSTCERARTKERSDEFRAAAWRWAAVLAFVLLMGALEGLTR